MDYRFGPYRLETAKRRLWRGDELLALTPKAFDTLLVLVTRAGATVEKDEILKAVWPDTFVEEATLAQNISTLRKILGDASDTPTYIATVPRRGYRFLEPVAQVMDDGTTGASASDGNLSQEQSAQAARGAARRRVWMVVSAVLSLALIVVGVRLWSTRSAVLRPVTFSISPPEGASFSTSGGLMAISPDGRNIVFAALSSDGTERLWLRALDSLTVRLLPGTEGASQPFWSPDSRSIAFFADAKLKKIGIAGEPVQTVCGTPVGSIPLAGTWNSHDVILFSSVREGIVRVQAPAGIATSLIRKEPEDDSVGWPQFLPDGRHFLYLRDSTQPDRAGIYVGALDSAERARVVATRSYAIYEPTGHLLFVQGGRLVAQSFDDVHHKLTGNPIVVAEGVAFNAATGRGVFSLSHNGVLAYRTVGDTQLVWFDKDGKSLRPAGPVGGYLQFAISPDNAHIAAARIDPAVGTSDIWILEAHGSGQRRLTFDTAWETSPLWSRDGTRIAFKSQRRGRWEIYETASNGEGPERRLLASDTSVSPSDWSPDGRVLFEKENERSKGDFWLIDQGENTRPTQLANLQSDESSGRISPDGRWLAYREHESEWALYVRPFDSITSRWRISSWGEEPRWRGDGRQLFFLAPDLSVMAVDIEAGPAFRASAAHRLFRTQAVAPSGLMGQAYDVASDGQRFLVKIPAVFSQLTVVVNWTALVQNRP